jgi:hypothetical protein
MTNRERAEGLAGHNDRLALVYAVLAVVDQLAAQNRDPETVKWDKARRLADDLLGEREMGHHRRLAAARAGFDLEGEQAARSVPEKDVELEAERLATQDPAELYKTLPASGQVIYLVGQNEGAWQRSHELAALLRDKKEEIADLPYREAVGDLLQAVREWLRGYGEEI